MSTYAIGDIQGCFLTFQKLLKNLSFHPPEDKLWLVGDLVNRGPHSLEVLQWCFENQEDLHIVLGNHDLHLLCRIANISPEKPLDTLDPILHHPHREKWMEWLLKQAFVHHEKNHLLVHGGVLPAWSLSEIIHYNHRAQLKLRSPDWKNFLDELRHSKTPSDEIQAIRIFTQIRMCKTDGKPEFKFKGSPDKAPEALIPWFDFPERKTVNETVVFGHWAALGFQGKKNILALDSGCVWGRELTAIRLEDRMVFQQKMID